MQATPSGANEVKDRLAKHKQQIDNTMAIRLNMLEQRMQATPNGTNEVKDLLATHKQQIDNTLAIRLNMLEQRMQKTPSGADEVKDLLATHKQQIDNTMAIRLNMLEQRMHTNPTPKDLDLKFASLVETSQKARAESAKQMMVHLHAELRTDMETMLFKTSNSSTESLRLTLETECEQIQAQATAVVLDKLENCQAILASKINESRESLADKVGREEGYLSGKLDASILLLQGLQKSGFDYKKEAITTALKEQAFIRPLVSQQQQIIQPVNSAA